MSWPENQGRAGRKEGFASFARWSSGCGHAVEGAADNVCAAHGSLRPRCTGHAGRHLGGREAEDRGGPAPERQSLHQKSFFLDVKMSYCREIRVLAGGEAWAGSPAGLGAGLAPVLVPGRTSALPPPPSRARPRPEGLWIWGAAPARAGSRLSAPLRLLQVGA